MRCVLFTHLLFIEEKKRDTKETLLTLPNTQKMEKFNAILSRCKR